MKKIQLKETELVNLIKKVIKEQNPGTITKDDLMGGIDKMCIDRPWDNEKMVGNRSCSRCHAPLIDLIKGYCGVEVTIDYR